MRTEGAGGFTLVEIMLALAFTALLVLGVIGITFTMDRANSAAAERVEAEHSCQATLDYLLRELQVATAFYVNQAGLNTISYRRTQEGVYTYWLLRVGDDRRLYRDRFSDNTFTLPTVESQVISDGINSLEFVYISSDGLTEVDPGTTNNPKMFFMIKAALSVTCGQAKVVLASAVSPLNIMGQFEVDSTNEVV